MLDLRKLSLVFFQKSHQLATVRAKGVKCHMSMDRIPRYKQTEAMILGIIVPLALAIYTAHLALNDEAVFWGRSLFRIFTVVWIISINVRAFSLAPLQAAINNNSQYLYVDYSNMYGYWVGVSGGVYMRHLTSKGNFTRDVRNCFKRYRSELPISSRHLYS